jgi:hypothetical protein
MHMQLVGDLLELNDVGSVPGTSAGESGVAMRHGNVYLASGSAGLGEKERGGMIGPGLLQLLLEVRQLCCLCRQLCCLCLDTRRGVLTRAVGVARVSWQSSQEGLEGSHLRFSLHVQA